MTTYLIEEGLYRIPVPVPFPMKFVYCYLIKGETGWTLIDTGFNYEEARQCWQQVFTELKIHPQEIKTIYLTHFHPDHLGLAGWMQELSGAPVYISPVDHPVVYKTWGPESQQVEKMRELTIKHGVPKEIREDLIVQMSRMEAHVTPLPELTKLTAKRVVLGDQEWEVIDTPGHSDGHICFYHPKKKYIFCGDHILDKITPNIGLWPDCHPNPLKNYLDSLKKVASLEISKAFPAHGQVITNVHKRIEELLIHHEERLNVMADIVKEKAQTAYQVATKVFNHKTFNGHQWRFALAETLSHLEYLLFNQRLAKREEENIIYYNR